MSEKSFIHIKEDVALPLSKTMRQICGSIFRGYNSFFLKAYYSECKTIREWLTILGIRFFLLTFVASYTSKFASILTENAKDSKIESIDDAVQSGYNFCGSRNQVSDVMKLYNLEGEIFRDIEDGEQGLSSNDRARSLDFMKSVNSNKSLHCNAALLTLEDTDVMQSNNAHCNKTAVGVTISYIDIGIPINDAVSKELITFFQELKNGGLYQELMRQAKPTLQYVQQVGDQTRPSIINLSGVWVTNLSLDIAGIIAKVTGICSIKI